MSFSIYLLHFPILFTFACAGFIPLTAMFPEPVAVAITFIGFARCRLARRRGFRAVGRSPVRPVEPAYRSATATGTSLMPRAAIVAIEQQSPVAFDGQAASRWPDLSLRSVEVGVWRGGRLLAALSVILLAPLLITDVPPVLDYPNHLARLVLLAAGTNDKVLGPIFTPDWTIIPNLAGDVIGLTLLHLLPVHAAGRCLLGGILLLNLAGVLALHRAYFGQALVLAARLRPRRL